MVAILVKQGADTCHVMPVSKGLMICNVNRAVTCINKTLTKIKFIPIYYHNIYRSIPQTCVGLLVVII